MDQHLFTVGGARSGETEEEGKGEGKWKMGKENEESLSIIEQFKNTMRLVEWKHDDSTGATGGKFRYLSLCKLCLCYVCAHKNDVWTLGCH